MADLVEPEKGVLLQTLLSSRTGKGSSSVLR